MFLFFQDADLDIVFMLMPWNNAFEVEADLQVWAEYFPLSIPLMASISLIHLAIVSFEAALCGFFVVMNRYSESEIGFLLCRSQSQWAETQFLWTYGHNSFRNYAMIVVEGSLEAYLCPDSAEIIISFFHIFQGSRAEFSYLVIWGILSPKSCFQ